MKEAIKLKEQTTMIAKILAIVLLGLTVTQAVPSQRDQEVYYQNGPLFICEQRVSMTGRKIMVPVQPLEESAHVKRNYLFDGRLG